MLASVVFLGCANKTVDNDDAAPTPSSEQIQGLTSRVDGTYCSPIWGVRLTPPGRLDMPGGVVDVALVDGFFLEISGHSSDLALDEAVRDEIEAQPLAFGASPTITVEKVPGARDARRVSSDADVGSSEYPSSSLVLLEYETPVAVGERSVCLRCRTLLPQRHRRRDHQSRHLPN